MNDNPDETRGDEFSHDKIWESIGRHVEEFQQRFADLKAGALPQIPVWNWQNDADRRLANDAALDLYACERDWPAHLPAAGQLAYADAMAVIVTGAVRPGVPTLLPHIAEHLDECAAALRAQGPPDFASFRKRLGQLYGVLFNTIDPDHDVSDGSWSQVSAAAVPSPDSIGVGQLRALSPLRGWTADSREEYLAGLGAGAALHEWLSASFPAGPAMFAEAMGAVGVYRRKLSEYGDFTTLGMVDDYLYLCARVALKVDHDPVAFLDCVASTEMTLRSTDLRYEPK